MKKLINIIIIALGIGLTAPSVVHAQSQLYALGSTGVAIRIYNGYTGSLSIACLNAGSNFAIVANGQANTIPVTAFTNAASLALAFGGVTDAANRAYAVADISQSLPTDTIVGMLTAGSNTVAAGGWIRFYYNTTLTKAYQTGIPRPLLVAPGQSFQVLDVDRPNMTPLIATLLQGQPTGTGTVTVAAYINGQPAYSRTILTPTYVLGAGNTNVASEDVSFSLPTRIRIGPTDSFILRATRATSAPATGNIGATIEPQGL